MTDTETQTQEHTQTQTELERRNAFLQLLQVVTVAANGAPTALTDALQSTLDEVCAHTRWTIAHVLMPSDDGSGDLVSTGIWHIDDPVHLTELRRRHDEVRFAPNVGVPGRVFATGKPEFIADVRVLSDDDADRVRCALIDAEDLRALAAYPIILGDETAGVLEFFSDVPYVVDGPLLDVLVQVGMLLGRVVERSRYEAALRDARETAEVASSAKTEFMAHMNHELRTPLNAVLGFAELLQLGELAGDGEREGVVAIEKAGNHLLALINDILDVSRMEKGALSLSMEPVAVTDIALDIVSLLAPLAESRHVSLATDVSATDARQFVLADSRALKQVLLNLVANGIKYNREGGGRVLVTVARDGEDHVRIAVSDDGYGIEASRLSDIFVPFERLGIGHTVEGTGLGLAIAKQLTEAMGGVLDVHSTVDAGSTFAVVLPDAAGAMPQSEVDASPAPVVVSSPGASYKVLYVEDNVANIQLMESIFARQRPHITLIPTMLGELALGLAREHAPHLILLDVGLPDIDGIEVLSQLKLDVTTQHIPVIMVSADAVTAQIDRTLAAGAYGYITKPINVARLLELVDLTVGDQRGNAVKLTGRRPAGAVPIGRGS
jgi:signal transduction histidine kinase/ActR/RegA family two-component response regulator